MFDFIPIEFYNDLWYHSILLICLFTYLHTLVLPYYSPKITIYNKVAAFYLLWFVLLYIGFRPINGVFIDMTTYARMFERFKMGNGVITNDYGFNYFLLFCTKIMSVKWFFFICACIYTLTIYKACKNWFPTLYFFAFLLFVCSFSFWAYGTNGIRNGMATSLFILAISYQKKNNFFLVLFMLLSCSFHTSMTLPIAAYILTRYVTDTKKYYFFWFLAILLSITMGRIWENIFANLGFGDDRLSGYLTTEAGSKFSSTGFRFDFLLYSAAPLILAYIYKFKNGFKDPLYDRILHTYMISNAFWIMVIRANFTNRFAYLSWFMMAVVIIYPLLKQHLWQNQFQKIGTTLVLYYAFSYFMFFYFAR